MNLSHKPPRWRAAYRPSNCTVPATRRVCALVRQGLGLREIAERPGMPTLDTLMRWIDEEELFRGPYERARQTQSEIFADDVVTLADALAAGDFDGLKLRIDARKWHVTLTRKSMRTVADDGPVDDETIRRLGEAAENLARYEAAEAAETIETGADDVGGTRDGS
ncbi:MAG TPA: hypothetical protein VL966_06945 [Alphaproteobacteria bacterium]|jgi:hypothetical protein|nr:hypothetical protein [Alphaproteobacteria bacterium]